MNTIMKVDGYEVGSDSIRLVIEKLTEADGSPLIDSRIERLADAARLIALAIAEEIAAQREAEESL